MSFDRLDYVMAIAEEQNMTKAAARLFISQPALTASINKLEEELGVKLFDRQRPPIKLTPAGVLYMKEMSRIHQLQFNLPLQEKSPSSQLESEKDGASSGFLFYYPSFRNHILKSRLL